MLLLPYISNWNVLSMWFAAVLEDQLTFKLLYNRSNDKAMKPEKCNTSQVGVKLEPPTT